MVSALPHAEICPMCGGLGSVSLNIPDIKSPWFGRAFKCPCRDGLPQPQQTARAFGDTHIPKDLRWRTFEVWETLPERVREEKKRPHRVCSRLAHNGEVSTRLGIKKQWVILSGLPGVGKSTLAAAAALHLHELGREVLWVDVNDMLETIQATYSKKQGPTRKELTDAAGRADVLVLDDMGDMESADPVSRDKRDILYSIIRARHLSKRVTLITTNLDRDQFIRQFGRRITRRVMERGVWVSVTGADISQYGEA